MCFVRPLPRPQHKAQPVFQQLFGGLTVLFIHSKEKERRHQRDHDQKRGRIADKAPRQKIRGKSGDAAERKANQLPLGEVEHDLCFDLC